MNKPDETNVQDTNDTSQNSTNLKNELDQCQLQVSAWKDKYVYLAADFENYKKRIERDRFVWELMTKKKLIVPILTILDDVDRALNLEQKKDQGEAQFVGFTLIAKELYKILESFGVHPMEQYKTFDPEYHEAITQIASENHASGDIVEVLQKGFMLGDTVLRPAKVAVAE